MAVPIGGAGEVLGLLTIAKHEAGAFNDEWCVCGPAVSVAVASAAGLTALAYPGWLILLGLHIMSVHWNHVSW